MSERGNPTGNFPDNVHTYQNSKFCIPVTKYVWNRPAIEGQEYMCSVCLEVLLDPWQKIGDMPCKHVTCVACLQKIVDRGDKRCPVCRGRFRVYHSTRIVFDRED